MAEIRVRIDESVRKDLLLLTVLEEEESMGKMIRKLIDFYEQSKEGSHGEEIQCTNEAN